MFVKVMQGTRDIYDGHQLSNYDQVFLLYCEADCGCLVKNDNESITVWRENLIFID